MLEQPLPSFTWFNPTRVVFGPGKLADLRSVVNEVAGDGARAFLVTGQHALRSTGVLQRVLDLLGEDRTTLFDRVTPFPSPKLVDEALEACREASPDIVVAVGGGSPMDVAKAVAVLMAHDGTSREYGTAQKRLERPGLPFVAVPTTSGSSSEVTSGSALWDMEAKMVIGLNSPLMFPDAAVVDPELAMTMPKSLAAVTGMDAFTSAFESYWSTESEPMSDALDLEAIRLFSENLETSCTVGDLRSRSACALAATISGVAYSNSRPNVCHGVGSPLTLFWDAEHGQAVGVTLTTFLRSQAEGISHKLPALWDALGVSDLDEADRRITQIMDGCGLATRLSGLGLTEGDLGTLLDNVRWDRLETLPVPLAMDSVRRLLQRLL